jgi:hypothetical protein
MPQSGLNWHMHCILEAVGGVCSPGAWRVMSIPGLLEAAGRVNRVLNSKWETDQ